MRHRQPLRRALLHGLSPESIALHRPLLEAELNVKDVSVLADVSSLVRREVALDYRRLGKRLRREMQRVSAAVAAGELVELGSGRIEAGGQVIEGDEYAMRYVPKRRGEGVATSGDLVVVLDLALDEALLREGLARDLNRAVQDLRKQAQLAYEERIVLSLLGDGPLAGVLDDHAGWLMEQCLAVAITREPLSDAAASAEVALGTGAVRVALARSVPRDY
jgi:isoleucyl-tRNA synthetase